MLATAGNVIRGFRASVAAVPDTQRSAEESDTTSHRWGRCFYPMTSIAARLSHPRRERAVGHARPSCDRRD